MNILAYSRSRTLLGSDLSREQSCTCSSLGSERGLQRSLLLSGLFGLNAPKYESKDAA
jgi:hypothetical protein